MTNIQDPLKNPEYFDFLKYECDPINSDIAGLLRSRLMKVLDKINYHAIYVSDDVIKIPDGDDTYILDHFPSALIASFLVNRSSTIVEGSSGTGKTSTIRVVARLMSGCSINKMDNFISCDPSLSKEDWIGSLDPKNIFQGGGLEICWAKWISDIENNVLIIDEIDKAPRELQAQSLLLMNDARIQYGIKYKTEKPEIKLYMTLNPSNKRRGVYQNDLNPAFLDRVVQYIRISPAKKHSYNRWRKSRIDDRSLGYNEDEIYEPIINTEELRTATILAQKIPIDDEADKFAIYLSRDADICLRSPCFSKEYLNIINPNTGLCGGGTSDICAMKSENSICDKIFGGSMRIYQNLLALSKAYAFFIGMPFVTKHLINAIAPDVVCHHLYVPDNILRTDVANTFGDPRTYIEKNFFAYCWEKIKLRKECEILFKKIIEGSGTENDLNVLLKRANGDLYIKIDMLPTITSGLNFRGNTNDSKNVPLYSCVSDEYKNSMKKINDYFNDKNSEKLNELMNDDSILSNPLKNLLQNQIFDKTHEIDFSNIKNITKPRK